MLLTKGALFSGVDGFSLTCPCQKLKKKNTFERTLKHHLSTSPQDKIFIIILLIKVDATAVPALYVVDQLYPWSLRTSLKYNRLILKIFTYSMQSKHWFTLKTTRKDLITSGNFSLFLFYYLHTVHFSPAGKRWRLRNLSFDQFTLAL